MRPIPELCRVVRLLDERGRVWGESLERSGDALHLYPPARWQPGEVVRADFDVNLNPATPAGRYRLVAQGTGAAEATCGEIEVK